MIHVKRETLGVRILEVLDDAKCARVAKIKLTDYRLQLLLYDDSRFTILYEM